MYHKLGFELVSTNAPSFTIQKGKKRESRFKYQKHKLTKMGFNIEGKTANQVLLENGLFKIYDSGTYTFKMNI